MSSAHYPGQLLDLPVDLSSHQCDRCAELARLAYFDQLTGLANRVNFQIRLDRAIESAARKGTNFAVLFLDLNDFKSVNDTLGHDAGDRLLQQVAMRLEEAVREDDVVARLGGDEFAILLDDAGDSPLMIAERVRNSLEAAAFSLDGESVYISASLGVATYPHDSESSRGLLRQADSDMYTHKRAPLLKVGS